jgi:hypothetical protein
MGMIGPPREIEAARIRVAAKSSLRPLAGHEGVIRSEFFLRAMPPVGKMRAARIREGWFFRFAREDATRSGRFMAGDPDGTPGSRGDRP